MSELRFTEEVAVVGTIDPDAYAADTYYTDVIDMELWGEVAFTLMAGTLGSSATVDFSIEADSASGFASPTTIRSATQLTEAGTDSDKQVVLTVRDRELAADGDRYVRGKLVIATAACDASVIAQGFKARYAPASDNDLASVDEIKNTGT